MGISYSRKTQKGYRAMGGQKFMQTRPAGCIPMMGFIGKERRWISEKLPIKKRFSDESQKVSRLALALMCRNILSCTNTAQTMGIRGTIFVSTTIPRGIPGFTMATTRIYGLRKGGDRFRIL